MSLFLSSYRNLYQSDPLYDITGSTSAKDVSIESVMKSYNSRNGLLIIVFFCLFADLLFLSVTLLFNSNSAYVERRGDLFTSPVDSDVRYFNVSITIRVPTQEIL
jgi:hypothetical protein